jgi:hypothetical protein
LEQIEQDCKNLQLLSENKMDLPEDIKEKATSTLHTLTSIKNDHFKTLCINTCGLKNYKQLVSLLEEIKKSMSGINTYQQLDSLLEKIRKTGNVLLDSEHDDTQKIICALKKSKDTKNSIFNMYGIDNARMYARIIFDKHNHRRLLTGDYKPKKLYNIMNDQPLSTSQEKNLKTFYINEDIARYITSYTDTNKRLHV